MTMRNNRGAAMMILVFFFVFISLILLAAIVTPSVGEFRIASSNLKLKQAYYLATSGAEDAVYRIKTGKQIDSTEMITVDGSSVVTTISSNGDTVKDITSRGIVDGYAKEVSVHMVRNEALVWNAVSWKESL